MTEPSTTARLAAPAPAQPPPPASSAPATQADPQSQCGRAVAARFLAGLLRRSLPPADVIPLDSGYLVVRRHNRHHRQPQPQQELRSSLGLPRGWAAEHERRYRRHLSRLHLLACARLALPKDGLGPQAGEARFLAVLAVALAAQPC